MSIESEKPEIDYIRYLKNNLLDTYKYGDGFTVFKELIQNASDAESNSLKVYVLDSLKNANCTEALRTPAIVVYDDGKFTKENKAGIIKIASDNKTSESTKIGRYGLGMKSIFHLCDFFIYAANTKDFPYERVFPVNYWPDNDDRFKYFSDEDINSVLNSLPEDVDVRKKEGFILYIPIKLSKPNWKNVISDPVKDYPFGSYETLKERIPISLALLSEVAPQENKLKSILYSQAGRELNVFVENKEKIKKIVTISESQKSELQFITYTPKLSEDVVKKVENLKKSEFWTKEQKDNLKPEVCFELLKTDKSKTSGRLNINFCVYLPLEEDYCSKSFDINSEFDYTILIHSNFAVDSGRRGIRGFGSLLEDASEIGIDSEEGIQKLWNKYLAQMVLFPALPLFLNESKKIISTHKDFCEISNKLAEIYFSYSGRNIYLKNSFTVQNYGFANLYGQGWTSFKLETDKSNYIFLPFCNENKDIQTLFPNVKDATHIFVLKTPEQKFILPDEYCPDELYLSEVINNIPVAGLTEERYIVLFSQFVSYQQNVILCSTELQKTVINHLKTLLSTLSFDDLSKNQMRLGALFNQINEATGNSIYKIYSIGQKTKSDFIKTYLIEDFQSFWKKESSFIFVPGFIELNNELIPDIKQNVFEGNETICDFIKLEENCRPQLHYNILSSLLGSSYESCLKSIAEKFSTLQIFKVTEAFTSKVENLNYNLITDLINEKKIFMTQSNPSDKDTVFFHYVKTVAPISIYHISKKIRDLAGFEDNEIPSSDIARNIFDSFSKLFYDSVVRENNEITGINLNLNTENWKSLLDEGFKNTYEISPNESDFYRFLFSGFDTSLRNEPLASFQDDVPEVWKKVYKNIAPDTRKIPIDVPTRAKEQIRKNENLLNIKYLDRNGCKEKLKSYANIDGSLEFFKSDDFRDTKIQIQLFECFTTDDSELFKRIPLHVSTESGNLISADGKSYLNPNKITFPEGCELKIKLIKASENSDLYEIQKRLLPTLSIKEAVREALNSKRTDADIFDWVFEKISSSGNSWKDLFESADGTHAYYAWIPVKKGERKIYCDIQSILNDSLFSPDTRNWISEHYDMYNISDLSIPTNSHYDSSAVASLLKSKLLAKTYKEQMDFIAQKIDKKITFKLAYEDSKKFFADFALLKDFEEEPIFGLINVLKQERKNEEEVFNFYRKLKTPTEEGTKNKIFKDLLNFITRFAVKSQTINLYKTILNLYIKEENFDISAIKYPTKKNEWKDACNISASNSSSISDEYLLNDEIYFILQDSKKIKEDNYRDSKELNDKDIVLKGDSDINEINELFLQWEKSLDRKKLLYLFFYLLKDNFKKIALEPNKLRPKDLLPLTQDLHYVIKQGSRFPSWNEGFTKEQAVMDINPPRGHFRLRLRIPTGKQTYVHSILGSLISIDIVEGNEIYTEEPWYNDSSNEFQISLINTKGDVNNLDEKLEKLIWLTWKSGYKQFDASEFQKMIQNFKSSNQNTIKTAQLFMFENLIPHLKDLNLKHKFFRDIFNKYNNLLNEKARKENAMEDFSDYQKRKNDLSQRLISFITGQTDKDGNKLAFKNWQQTYTKEEQEEDLFIEEIFNCVVKKITQYQYDQSRILFELLQNADDSVCDLKEAGLDISNRTRFEVEYNSDSSEINTPYGRLIISHYGRLINEVLSKEKEDKHSNDLLNMLLVNSSEKDDKDTGKFGLGFKSIYFICQEPIIRSGELQFKILGALYPTGDVEPLKENKTGNENRTRIELNLNKKAQIDVIFNDFEKNAELQVLFCKYIDSIKVRGTDFHPTPLSEVDKDKKVAIFKGKKLNYLRFRLSNGSLVFKISQDGKNLESFGSSSVARLWNLTPLGTARTLPFAINSNFEVDVGRKNLDESNSQNSLKLKNLAEEFSNEICNLETDFKVFIPSLMDLVLIGCGINDCKISNNFCKEVLTRLYEAKKIIPDGIGGVINKPHNPYFISPNRFKLDSDSRKFADFIKKLQSSMEGCEIITRNVYEVLSESALDFNEIDNSEKILKLIANGDKISNKVAESFMEIVSYIPEGLSTGFYWNLFKVLGQDGDWQQVRAVVSKNSFADDYSLEVINFFKSHVTFQDISGTTSSTNSIESDEHNSDDGIEYNKCTVIDVYNKWKKLSKNEWQTKKQEYYNRLFPSIIMNESERNKDLNISPDYFESYNSSHPTMPKSWCILFMLGNLQSQNYYGEQKSEEVRKNKIESLMPFIESFSDGNTLDSIYDQYLNSHETDENELREFESLLRTYKFRKKFMEIWAQFYGIKHEDSVELNMLLNASTAAKASGKGLSTYASQKSLKYGISMIVRELLDSGFFGNNDVEQEKAFNLLNKYTYIPHAYLRRIAFNDWKERPLERTSEEIHNAILEALRAEHLKEEEIKEFMKCHDLPFLILGEKK